MTKITKIGNSITSSCPNLLPFPSEKIRKIFSQKLVVMFLEFRTLVGFRRLPHFLSFSLPSFCALLLFRVDLWNRIRKNSEHNGGVMSVEMAQKSLCVAKECKCTFSTTTMNAEQHFFFLRQENIYFIVKFKWRRTCKPTSGGGLQGAEWRSFSSFFFYLFKTARSFFTSFVEWRNENETFPIFFPM